jgi:REP element-mobilizing transposase RayT
MAGVPHTVRAQLTGRDPVHATLRLLAGLPSLRTRETYGALLAVLAAACDRVGFRIVHYSVQGNHLHLIIEATDAASMTRGMQGLAIRIAKTLNRLWQRTGSVFRDRYHSHVLRTPREVRHALCYVLHNAKKHGLRILDGLDRFASGAWFDGWKERFTVSNRPAVTPVAAARTWLLRAGWRRHGLVSLAELPRGALTGTKSQ